MYYPVIFTFCMINSLFYINALTNILAGCRINAGIY